MRLFPGFVLAAASQVLNLAGALATRALMARLMGPAGYGGFGIALNIVTVMSKALAFGTAPAVQYYASKTQDARPDFVRTVLALATAMGAGTTVVVLLLPYLFPGYFERQPIANSIYPALACGTFAIVSGAALASLLIPWGRILAYTVIQAVPGAFLLVLFGGFAVLTEPLTAAVIGYMSAWAISLGYAVWALRGEMPGGRFRWAIATKIMRYGLVAWPNVILAIGGARVAILLGAIYVTESAMGLFVVALNVIEGVFAFHAPLGQLLFTRVSEQESESFGVAQESMRVSVCVLLAVALVFWAVGKPLLLLLFGDDFTASWRLSLVLLATGVSHALIRVHNTIHAGMGRPAFNSVTLGVETGLLLALVPLLARNGGVMGVAVASVVSSFSALAVATILTRKVMACSLVALYVPTPADVARLRRRIRAAFSGRPTIKHWGAV